MSLRSKRLSTPLDPQAARFLDSTSEDTLLIEADLLGSLAHVQALSDAGVLDTAEAETLRVALTDALVSARAGAFPLDPVHEDVHMNVEAWLTARVGDLGKKLHTGRSRNDQVALDLRLAARAHVFALSGRIIGLVDALGTLGDKAPAAVMPGCTHLQPAQPVTFGHWTGLHAERFLRDLGRLFGALGRIDVCPLGAAALAGTSFALDPAATAARLGFQATFRNSMDAVSDRDFLVELAAVEAQLFVHVSQLAEDVILYVTPAYGLLRLPDAFATGSSIMPQKKNPDVFEVARGAAGTAMGTLVAALTTLKGSPSAYNRDLQEMKRVVLPGWNRTLTLFDALVPAVSGLEPDVARMEAAAGIGHTDATEVADHLVRHGVPFRSAHEAAAILVDTAQAAGVPLSGLSDEHIAPAVGLFVGSEGIAGLRAVLGAQAAAAAKTSPGGTAPEAVAEQRELQRAERERLAAAFLAAEKHVAHALFLLIPNDRIPEVKAA
ncbi:MAG: argininosuccinate lyase [Euryarchaeota archaeon]|nr:argininosuccinate lyase [Euryarchaeota archaeon]